jgi:hypothetical protein
VSTVTEKHCKQDELSEDVQKTDVVEASGFQLEWSSTHALKRKRRPKYDDVQ